MSDGKIGKGEIGFVKASALKARDRFILDDDWL